MAFLITSSIIFAQADIDGFRDYKWDTPFSKMSEGMKATSSKTPGFKGYEKDGDNLTYNGFKAKSIIYLFKKDLFIGVTIALSNDDYDKVVKYYTNKYGESKYTEMPFLKNHEWHSDKSMVTIAFLPTNKDDHSVALSIGKERK